MSEDGLSALARAAGLALDWEDTDGVSQRVSAEAARRILTALGHPCATDADCRESLHRLQRAAAPSMQVVDAGQTIDCRGLEGHVQVVLEDETRLDLTVREGRLPPIRQIGYHRLHTRHRDITLAVCPPRAVTPFDRMGRRGWGLTAQIYSLPGETAFGDFGDLARFAKTAADAGADALAISPVHALFAASPDRYSPYSPSSRERLNGLYAVSDTRPDATEAALPLIDWANAWPRKVAGLRESLGRRAADPDFAKFVLREGEGLRHHALFEALHGHFKRTQSLDDWRTWPAAFQTPETASRAVGALALNQEIQFHLLLQWAADRDLTAAHTAAREGGMGVGLIADLAVGLDPRGSHAWSRPEDLLQGLTLGAPPDAFQADGQGWGVTTFSPAALERLDYAPFLRTLRAAFRHAGGVRIDHALGLKRLWVLPDDASPLDGAYLKQPFATLLRLIALESHRANAVVIGEDLGVVPPGLRDQLAARGVLGMRVLPFERDEAGRFRAPGDYDAGAVAMTSTHDMPPIAGWWNGSDIAWRARSVAAADTGADTETRRQAKAAFWTAAVSNGAAEGPAPVTPETAVDAAIAYVAKTPCALSLIPAEDLLGLDTQVNVPGTVEEHPNWRRRLPGARARMTDTDVVARLNTLNTERPQ